MLILAYDIIFLCIWKNMHLILDTHALSPAVLDANVLS